ncbi:MAG: autotransporter-associated beta strand repeat-containing protein [Chthoniobacteraceae bacterium]
MKQSRFLLLVISLSLGSSLNTWAANATWTNTAGTVWNLTGNWNAAFPSATTDTATFDTTVALPSSAISLGQAISIANLTLQGATAGSLNITDTVNTLTLNSATPLNVVGGLALTLDVNTTFAAAATVSVGSGATLNLGRTTTFANTLTLAALSGTVNLGATSGAGIIDELGGGLTLNLQSNISKTIHLGKLNTNEKANLFITTSGVNVTSTMQIVGPGTGGASSNVITIGANISGGGTASYGGSFSLNNGTNNAQTVVFSANAGTTVNFNGPLSSGGSLTLIQISGGGTIVLAGTNSFTTSAAANGTEVMNNTVLQLSTSGGVSLTGNTTVDAGSTIQLLASNQMTAGTMTLNGTGSAGATGALENKSGTNTLSAAIALASASTISSDTNTLTLTGGINNGGNLLTFGGAGNTTVNTTAITGAGGLTKTGAGTLVLANSQSYTGATTVNSGTLEVDGSLSGSSAVTVNAGTLSGTGTISGGLTVNAGGVTSPGVGSSTGIMTSDLIYSGSSMANFNVTGTGPGGAKTLSSSLFYSQMAVTGTAGQAGLLIGTGLTLGANSTVSASETANQVLSGTSTSGVTLKLSISTADYATLVSNATTTYQAKGTNNTLDNYFVFTLGSVLATGRFTTLDIDVNGVDAQGTIFYSGANDRFVADGVGNTIGDVIVDVNGVDQEFALSYTGVAGSNATIGGNDIVLTAIPEPGTWGMILGGFGMLVGFRKLRKSRVSRTS